MKDAQAIRQAILAAPFELDNKGEAPHPGTLHVPLAHRKALSREAVLVVGARGVGKSFWTAALDDDVLRHQIGASVQELTCTTVQVGYSANPNLAKYPDRDTFEKLIGDGHSPYFVWRAVVLRWLAGIAGQKVPSGSWNATVRWVAENPEPFAQVAEAANERLAVDRQFGLIVFDALDRTSSDWDRMNLIVHDLLRVALWLRDFSRLRAKVFLRPDAAEDSLLRYVDYPLALHYESLKRGIQKASQIRVEQVAEDDEWVPEAMRPLKGKNVPCDYDALSVAWEVAFPTGPGSIPSEHLPPQHAENGWGGIRQDLERLGILVTRKDGRIDMPDLYRVGFGLGRRGGVKPPG